MNGKNESIEISIPTNKPDADESSIRCSMSKVWCIWKEDEAIFGLKAGLSVVIVSLLALLKAPYQVFGTNVIWAIITAIIVFEYNVGATFNRGFNRALGSLVAGIFAIAVAQLALLCGSVAEPIIIGFSIFFIVSIASMLRSLPRLVQYEYGFRVIQISYCIIIISGYRMGNPIKTMMDRWYSIAIGGIISVFVNVFVYPMWAGDQLHKDLVKCFDSLSDSLQECVKKYLEERSHKSQFASDGMDEILGELAYERCHSNLVNSGPKFEMLANSAKWEPPHGRFLRFVYPWSQYLKVAAVLRHCAYEVMALDTILHSEIQAPYNLRIVFESEIKEVSNEVAELVRILGRDISSMKWSLKDSHVKRVHSATKRLQHSMQLHSYPLLTATSQEDSEITREMLPRMRALESTTTLSLVNFASSIVEFVARVDYLVEEVDRLSKMAKFKHDGN
ncbi:hypothetical protein PIB30_000647 [Stylosanthes scabra]|uniref:Aluminum-activated malate transporter n=1 Tax=Stylosanthes scabra TaxID=79078 RepID=A0ABU6XZT6_9FABA|nr:hypothetical protein [Stylosanthes scabra]